MCIASSAVFTFECARSYSNYYLSKCLFTVEEINKKIIHLRSYYGRELSKERKTQKSGASTDELYKSKWPFFNLLGQFLRAQITPHGSVSNLVRTNIWCICQFPYAFWSCSFPLPFYLTICIKVITQFISDHSSTGIKTESVTEILDLLSNAPQRKFYVKSVTLWVITRYVLHKCYKWHATYAKKSHLYNSK